MRCVKKLGRFEGAQAVERNHFVEGALRRAFGRRAVVADDVIDQRIVERLDLFERVDQPADVIIGELEEKPA